MPALNNEQKVFIVQCFAAYKTPSEIAEAVNLEFKLKVSRQQVWKYSPDNPQTSDQWKEMFKGLRERFVAQLELHGVTHKAYRMAELQDLYRQAKRQKGNILAAAQLLEQAAKEMGGLYTNKREHSGPNGGAIPITVEDRRKNLAGQMLKKLVDKGITEEEARQTLVSMGVNEHDIPALQTD
jgi:hypothetical protein